MSDELKPCPFCGGTDLGYDKTDGQGVVSCNDCSAKGPVIYNSAADDWNQRVIPESVTVQGAMTYRCTECDRGIIQYGGAVDCECDYCNGTGQVAERRQSQRRKQGRRAVDQAEAMLEQLFPERDETIELLEASRKLLKSASINAHQKLRKRCANRAADIEEFLEKIND